MNDWGRKNRKGREDLSGLDSDRDSLLNLTGVAANI